MEETRGIHHQSGNI